MRKYRKRWIAVIVLLLLAVFLVPEGYAYLTQRSGGSEAVTEEDIPEGYETGVFAGGCFWCMEPPFEKLKGVKEAVSGYTGGHTETPTYKEVSAGDTGHVEAVQVYYDPDVLSYSDLLEVFIRQVDPTDAGGQFVDRGSSYTTGIFYKSEDQRKKAEAFLASQQDSGRFTEEIVTPIQEAGAFYRAEEYHQDYYKKNKLRYEYYRGNSGRDDYLEKTWGEDRDVDLPYKAEP
ncbi:UNVERIFIED_CONTAM: peptide-methionine (S)-S-oxide reductase MsrA [Halobacillus marinus]